MRYSATKAVVKKCPTQTKAQKWRAAQTGKPEYSQSLYNPKGVMNGRSTVLMVLRIFQNINFPDTPVSVPSPLIPP